jgi:hypothetical protein
VIWLVRLHRVGQGMNDDDGGRSVAGLVLCCVARYVCRAQRDGEWFCRVSGPGQVSVLGVEMCINHISPEALAVMLNPTTPLYIMLDIPYRP